MWLNNPELIVRSCETDLEKYEAQLLGAAFTAQVPSFDDWKTKTELTELARTDIDGEHFTDLVDRFHAITTKSQVGAVCIQAFEAAMYKVTDPKVRAEMMSRTFGSGFMEGWRPISVSEAASLALWLGELRIVDEGKWLVACERLQEEQRLQVHDDAPSEWQSRPPGPVEVEQKDEGPSAREKTGRLFSFAGRVLSRKH